METLVFWLIIGIIGWFIYSAIQSYAWMKDEESPAIIYKDYTDVAFFVLNFILLFVNLLTLKNGFEINNIIITIFNVIISYTTFTNTYLMQGKDKYKTFVVWSGKFFLVALFIYFTFQTGGAGKQRESESDAEYASRDMSTRTTGFAGSAAIGTAIFLMIAERKFTSLTEYFKSANIPELIETAKKKALEAKEAATNIKNHEKHNRRRKYNF